MSNQPEETEGTELAIANQVIDLHKRGGMSEEEFALDGGGAPRGKTTSACIWRLGQSDERDETKMTNFLKKLVSDRRESGDSPTLVNEEPPAAVASAKGFDITVGQFAETGHFFASTTLVNPHSGQVLVLSSTEPTEEEAVDSVAMRADAVLRTFFHSYKTVRI